MTLHLDTHVVAWLYAGEHAKFPDTLWRRLNSDTLRICPMVRLELTSLHEIGRITATAERILTEMSSSIGLEADAQSFARVVDIAQTLTFTRDPFDRLIVAQAIAAGAGLATKDERITEAFPQHITWA